MEEELLLLLVSLLILAFSVTSAEVVILEERLLAVRFLISSAFPRGSNAGGSLSSGTLRQSQSRAADSTSSASRDIDGDLRCKRSNTLYPAVFAIAIASNDALTDPSLTASMTCALVKPSFSRRDSIKVCALRGRDSRFT